MTHTLNNFPIAEIDKTSKVNEQALAINNSIKWREDQILTKFVFLLSQFESLLFDIVAMSSAKNHTMESTNVTRGNVTRCTIV